MATDLSTAEITQDRFADGLLRARAPSHVTCPQCHQGYAVFQSRLQFKQSRVIRALYNYYRCDRCQCRFRLPSLVAGASSLAAFGLFVGCMVWVALIIVQN